MAWPQGVRAVGVRWSVGLVVILGIVVTLLDCGVDARRRTLSNELEERTGDNVSTFEDRRPTRVDPQGSWLSFVRHSARSGGSARRGTRGGKHGRGRHGDNILATPICDPGPPGPAGPPGPRGPPGAEITQEILMKEFRALVNEAATRRSEKPVPELCTGCSKTSNATWRMVDVDQVNVIPRVAAGFHQRLKANVVVQGKTFLELKNFHRPFGGGAFQRGGVFSPSEGRFTSPRDAVYHFTANMHVAHEGYVKRRPRRLRRADNMRVLICIQSLCQKHTSLEFISGMESNSRSFTITVSGLLHLETGYHTSVYIDNNSARPVTVLEGSDFSGVLIGV